jgi:hypothetical protein
MPNPYLSMRRGPSPRRGYIYGFPLVDSYRVQYSYFVDHGNPEFKVPWNTLSNTARVYTPNDKAIQTPNSDTPYSFLGADLRAEPLVLTVPTIEEERYYSLQFIDMYTFNFAYVGSRATGNDGGSFLLAGPNWNGETPSGIKSVIRAETELPSTVGEPPGNGWLYPEALECSRRNMMGGGVGFFLLRLNSTPSLWLPVSHLLAPWLLGSS